MERLTCQPCPPATRFFFWLFHNRPDRILQLLPDLPALLLEAQMAADAHFFLRLYAESGRFLLQEKTIRHWLMVVICPVRTMAFGDPEPVS